MSLESRGVTLPSIKCRDDADNVTPHPQQQQRLLRQLGKITNGLSVHLSVYMSACQSILYLMAESERVM